MDVVSYLRLAGVLINADGQQRAYARPLARLRLGLRPRLPSEASFFGAFLLRLASRFEDRNTKGCLYHEEVSSRPPRSCLKGDWGIFCQISNIMHKSLDCGLGNREA